MLSLLARSPINCLIVEAGVGPIAEAARAAGKTLLETNSPAAAPLLKINWGTAGSFQLPSFSWYAALEFKS